MKQIKIEITLKQVEYWDVDWSDEEKKQRELEQLTVDVTCQLIKLGILCQNIEIKTSLIE